MELLLGNILDQIELVSTDFDKMVESSLSMMYCNEGWVDALVSKT